MKSEIFEVPDPITKIKFQKLIKTANVETTSLDGKPFLTPNQFGALILNERIKTANTAYSVAATAMAFQRQLKYKMMTSFNNLLHSNNIFSKEIPSKLNPFLKSKFDEDLDHTIKKIKTDSSIDVQINKYIQQKDHFCKETDSSEEAISIKRDEIRDKRALAPVKKSSYKYTLPKKIKDKRKIKSDNILSQRIIKEITNLQYDVVNKDFIFDVKIQGESDGGTPTVTEIQLTRQELLEKDPYSLLYFYEDHLEFRSDVNFNSKNLIKI